MGNEIAADLNPPAGLGGFHFNPRFSRVIPPIDHIGNVARFTALHEHLLSMVPPGMARVMVDAAVAHHTNGVHSTLQAYRSAVAAAANKRTR